MSGSGREITVKSMRHKRILDAAAEHPDATMSELASVVPSATTELVEDVLETHGDPAEDGAEPSPSPAGNGSSGQPDTESAAPGDGSSDSQGETAPDTQCVTESDDRADNGSDPDAAIDGEGAGTEPAEEEPDDTEYPSPGDLPPKQRETLRAIADRPDATQEGLATDLGVSAATVCNRVNSIEGFDWSERRAFVAAVFDTELPDSSHPTPAQPMSSDMTTHQADLEQLAERLSALEDRIDELDDGEGTERAAEAVFDDPELLHKVVHACLNAETISEEEELRILKAALG